jgi:K+-sensing histidine kinase KdpD
MSIEKNNQFEKNHPVIASVLNGMHEIAMILDSERKITYFNKKYEEFAIKFGLTLQTGVLPGNAFNCIHAVHGDDKCGTTDFCKFCGANASIQKSMEGEQAFSDCQIVSINGNSFTLQVSASPLYIDNEHYTLYCIQDISAETRKRTLEKIFFHDINNIVGGISLLGDMLVDSCEEKDNDNAGHFQMLMSAIETLKNEIHAQRIISMAEKDELHVNPAMTCMKDLISNVVQFFRTSTASNGIELFEDINIDETCITTDPVLVKRVIVNMVKNACEASREGQIVTIGYSNSGESVIVEVHNETVMSEKVSKSIFKRSFSTKGEGRGLGTYSMRLLTERYLKGSIYFTSIEGEGTTFFLELPLKLQG